MATTTESQAIKHQGSALRRTATTVRNLAAGLADVKKQQALIQAATIIEAEAATTMQKARQKATEEKRYDAAYTKALPRAEQRVATLPMATTAQKLAVLTEGYNGGYMLKMIRGEYAGREATPAALQRELTDALKEIARTVAHRAAKNGQPPEIHEHMLLRLAQESRRPTIVEAARLFDRLNPATRVVQ